MTNRDMLLFRLLRSTKRNQRTRGYARALAIPLIVLFLSSCILPVPQPSPELERELSARGRDQGLALLRIENKRSVEIDFNQSQTISKDVFSRFRFGTTTSSPDGRAIVGSYDWMGETPPHSLRGAGGIAIVDPTGAEKWHLPWRPYGSLVVAISNDAQRIAVQSTVKGLHYIQRDSGNVVIVDPHEDPALKDAIGWSSDGNRIVYSRGGKVLIADIHSKKITELAQGSDPTWSPDGQWIAYRSPNNEGILITPDGRETRTLIGGKTVLGSLRWSPGSEYVLYAEEMEKNPPDGIIALRCRLWIRRLRDGAEYIAFPALAEGPALIYQWIIKK